MAFLCVFAMLRFSFINLIKHHYSTVHVSYNFNATKALVLRKMLAIWNKAWPGMNW